MGLVRAPRTPPGAGPPTCSSARSRTRGGCVACSPSASTRRTSSRAMDEVMRRLGGTPRIWRTDRLATVIKPGTGTSRPSLRPGRQALRGGRRTVPAPAGQPQGLRRVLGALRLGPVVADDGCEDPQQTPSVPSTGSARRTGEERRASLRRRDHATTVRALAEPKRSSACPRAVPGDDRGRTRPWPTTPRLPIGATATRPLPGSAARVLARPPAAGHDDARCRRPVGSTPRHPPAARRTDRVRSCAAPSTTPLSKGRALGVLDGKAV